MNNKYILIAVLALAPVAIKGMNTPNAVPRLATKSATYKAYVAAGQREARTNIAYAEATKSGDVKGLLDARFDTEAVDKLFTPHSNEPSFFNRVGNQFAIGVAFALAGIATAHFAKKYLTPKTMLDREDAQATATEQAILRELETDIQRLMTGLPQRHKELETATNLEHIEYLKAVISKGEEQLQKKLAMHAALTQKFNEDQEQRYQEQLRRVGQSQKSTPAAAK